MHNLNNLSNHDYILSRAEAISQGFTHYFTGKPCKHNHIAIRSVLNGTCMECLRLKSASWYKSNANKHKAYSINWRKNNPEKTNQIYARYRARFGNARSAKYRASKLQATPKWLTLDQLEQIKRFYRLCPRHMHVDHIIPLQGKNVCGLHVPWNLQYLLIKDNLQKSNRLI